MIYQVLLYLSFAIWAVLFGISIFKDLTPYMTLIAWLTIPTLLYICAYFTGVLGSIRKYFNSRK